MNPRLFARWSGKYILLKQQQAVVVVVAVVLEIVPLISAASTSRLTNVCREKLDTMEIPYLVRNLPKGFKSGRQEFATKYADKISAVRKASGFVMVPLLVDPNTGTAHLILTNM